MQQQIILAVGGSVDRLLFDFDIAEADPGVFAQHLVVVAGNQHHVLAVPRPAENFLHHGVVRRRPLDAARHRPEIDDVANQVEIFRRMLAQKVDQSLSLAGTGAQMNIRNKNSANLGHGQTR